MNVRTILVPIVLAALTGCTATRLRQRTINQASTLTELQYQQVLNNLALFAGNPAALPWHVTLREGTTQITDSGNAGAAVDLGPPAETLPQAFASRTAVAQWGMSPVVDPTMLRLLRFAYRRAVGVPEMPGAEFLDELSHELKDQIPSNDDLRNESIVFYQFESDLGLEPRQLDARVITTNDASVCAIPADPGRERSPLARNVCRKVDTIQRDLARIRPGWFHVGRKRDVPKDACYVGRCGDRYVWVCADGREALTEFTLTVLKFSTLIKETQTLINPGQVKFSPGDRPG
jgi:hypothetical protein